MTYECTRALASGPGLRPALPHWLRHALMLVPVLLCGAFSVVAAAGTVSGSGVLQFLYVAGASLNMTVLALSSMSGMLGILALVPGVRSAFRGPVQARPTGTARTALLLPVYEEDPRLVCAAVAVMRAALVNQHLGTVAIHVLSDTQSAAGASAERVAFAEFARDAPDAVPVHYRRRADNGGRKTGNIADFCATWGRHYDFMLVLDADSLMTGDAVARLVGAMEANPGAGIIQTMIYPVGRDSLFARVQQFGARLYGPLLARGVEIWQGSRGSFWGHNAIIRIAPFMEHCGLPVLPGAAPLGGEILCHDTVEAALMVKAGWEVWLMPDETGSFEQTPTNLVDHLVRDRRWCQGNLQHIRLLRTPGLRTASLVHLSMGILHYLSPLLLVAFIATGAAMSGNWAQGAGAHALRMDMLGMVLVLMFAPKLASLAAALSSQERAAPYGGRIRLLASALLEQVFGLLAGPVSIVFYTVFVADILMGRIVKWDAQARGDRAPGWDECAMYLGVPVSAAALCVASIAACGAGLGCWLMAPGLVIAVPLAVLSGSSAAGLAARRLGLFLTPGETGPHLELAMLARRLSGGTAAKRADWLEPVGAAGGYAFAQAVFGPEAAGILQGEAAD